MSAIWGVAAFTGPLFGAVVAETLSWRWAFGLFSLAGLAMAAASFVVLSGRRRGIDRGIAGTAAAFPAGAARLPCALP